jgi:TPR repeat protein
MYETNKGIKQDYFKALEYFQKACELNSGGGCSNLGVAYKHGNGVKQDYFKAVEYYRKACDLKNKLGCENYAKLKKMTLKKEIKKDN